MPNETSSATQSVSLYERLGGAPAINSAVEIFYGRVLGDPMLSPFFEKVDISRQRQKQIEFLTQILGGPAIYRGRTMSLAHGKMEIRQSHFDQVAMHLSETLKSLNVPADLIHEVMAGVGSLAPQIVNRKE